MVRKKKRKINEEDDVEVMSELKEYGVNG